MTLGENIWTRAFLETDWSESNQSALLALRRHVIAAIDESLADLKRNHEAEIKALEDDFKDELRGR